MRPKRGRNETWLVIPDGPFALPFEDETASYFLLKINRDTIPIVRNSLDHRSIARKLATYYEGWRVGRHVQQFDVKQMRVLIVTESAELVGNMLSAIDQITGGNGSNFFLLVDKPTPAVGNPLKIEWSSGKRMSARLTG